MRAPTTTMSEVNPATNFSLALRVQETPPLEDPPLGEVLEAVGAELELEAVTFEQVTFDGIVKFSLKVTSAH